MEVIGFLHVSLGSSTAQLHDSLRNRPPCPCSDVGFRETVLEEYTTEKQPSVVRLFRAKNLNANDIHKEIFPVYDGKCFWRKAVHNWVEKFS
jgi:hypothetical protein